MPYIESTMDEFLEAANEGFLGDKKSVNELLSAAEVKFNKTLKTTGDCDDQLLIINNEARKFNECVSVLAKVKREYDQGKLDKKQFKEQVKAAVYLLKKNCRALQMQLGNIIDDAKAITKEELEDFKAYIEGLRKLVKEKKRSLVASPSVDSAITADLISRALEGEFDLDEIMKDEDSKLKKDKKDKDGDTEDEESDKKSKDKDDDKDDDKKDDKKKEDDSESDFDGESLDDDDDKKDKKKDKDDKKKDKDDEDDSDDKDDDKKSKDDKDDSDDDKDKDDSDKKDEDDESDSKDDKDDDKSDKKSDDKDDESDDDDDEEDDKKKSKKEKSDDKLNFDDFDFGDKGDKKDAKESVYDLAMEVMSQYDVTEEEAIEIAADTIVGFKNEPAMEYGGFGQLMGGYLYGNAQYNIDPEEYNKNYAAHIETMLATYNALPEGSSRSGYGEKIAKAIKSPVEAAILQKYHVWDKVPEELKIYYNAKVQKIAAKSGAKFEKKQAKISAKKGDTVISNAEKPNPKLRDKYEDYKVFAAKNGYATPEEMHTAFKKKGILIKNS